MPKGLVEIPAVRDKVRELAEDGMTRHEIAEVMHLSVNTISRIAKHIEVKLPRGKSGYDANNDRSLLHQERMHSAKILTKEGYSLSEIAVRLGVSRRQVVTYRKEAGVTQPAYQPYTPEQLETAVNLLEDGASYAEVGRTIKRAPHHLRMKFPGYGWKADESGAFGYMMRKTGTKVLR